MYIRLIRDVFYSTDVQERGITRIEISIYGSQKEITKERGQEVVLNVLNMVSAREPLFYIQPAKKQWYALAERLTKCFCLVDRPNSNIYMAWYANTLTKRIAGVKAELKNMVPDKLENFIQWFISDFGLKMVPIFRVDILETDTEKIYFTPIRCYIKNSNAYTYLTPCNRPTVLHKDAPDIEDFLPSTDSVMWKWRTKKERAYAERKPA